MNVLLKIVLLFCCLSSSTVHSQGGQPHEEKPRTSYARHEPTPKSGVPGVIELTTVKLDQHIRDGGIWLVEFYAPWCRYCNSFAMTYAQVAHDVHEKNPTRDRPIHVAKINGDKQRAAASRFGATSFPVFFLIDGWSVYKYEGTRSLENMVAFVESGYKDQSVSDDDRGDCTNLLKVGSFIQNIAVTAIITCLDLERECARLVRSSVPLFPYNCPPICSHTYSIVFYSPCQFGPLPWAL